MLSPQQFSERHRITILVCQFILGQSKDAISQGIEHGTPAYKELARWAC
jgi:hypothetical protein